MDALIRAVRLAPERTRLSETRAASAGAAADAKTERDRLREEIERQVRSELAARTQETLDGERERARAQGLQAAVAEANIAAVAQLEHFREQLAANVDRAVAALEQAHQEAIRKFEASVGEVAFAAVCRLLGRETSSRAFVMDVVENTCSRLRDETSATARLHPRDIELLRDLLKGRQLQLQSLSLRLVPDESLELGGCVVESASGHYDGGLESQLRRLHAVLTGTS